MSPEQSATERRMDEAELDNLLASGWRLSSSVWMADGNHVQLRNGDQAIGATVTANTQAGGRMGGGQ